MSVDISRLAAHLTPQQQESVKKTYHRSAQNATAAFITCFFLGVFGAHRFFLGQVRRGFLHLLLTILILAVVGAGLVLNINPLIWGAIAIVLLVIALLWVFIDLLRIDNEVYQHNLKLAESLVAQELLADHTVERQAGEKLDEMLRATAGQANDQQTLGRMSFGDASATSAGVALTGSYVATTVRQISDDPNATQAGQKPVPALTSVTTLSEPEPGVQETTTQTHQVTATSVTDSVETVRQASVAPTEKLIVEPLPTTTEAEAATWPDHPPVNFAATEPPTAPAQALPADHPAELVAAAGSAADAARVALAGLALGGAAAIGAEAVSHGHEATTAPATPATPPTATAPANAWPALDVTDSSGVDAAPPMADITANATPFVVTFPSDAQTMEATPAAPAPAAEDDSLLFLIPTESATSPAGYAEPSPDWSQVEGIQPLAETPAESYVPPTVPTVSDATMFANADAPFVPVFTPSNDTPTSPPLAESYREATPPPIAESHIQREPADETLAALAGGAALGAATWGIGEAHQQPAASPAPTPPEAQPAPNDAPAPASAAPDAPLADEPAAAPVIAGAALASAAPTPADTSTEEAASAAAQRALRKRIRVTRQVVVDGKIIDETSAEELISPDEDPEPVKARLREQLHRQAEEIERQHRNAQQSN